MDIWEKLFIFVYPLTRKKDLNATKVKLQSAELLNNGAASKSSFRNSSLAILRLEVNSWLYNGLGMNYIAMVLGHKSL